MKTKVSLLGLGFWGRNWLELILRTDRVVLAGVAGAPAGAGRSKEKI